MSIFIKTGFWIERQLGLKSEFNLTRYITELISGSAAPSLQEVTDVGATTTNSITANSFVKTGGTSSQFLKANGSVDSTAYTTAQNLQQVTNLGASTTNSITANSFIKTGGTSSQFLKADGTTSTDYKYNFSGSLTLTGTLTTTNLLTITIPANSLTNYLDLRSVMVQQSGTALAGMTVRVWHNTVNDFNTATRIANYAFGGGGADLFAQMTRKFSLQSTTLFGYPATPSNATGEGSNTNAPLSIPFSTAAVNYLFVSVQLNNVLDTATLRNVNITK